MSDAEEIQTPGEVMEVDSSDSDSDSSDDEEEKLKTRAKEIEALINNSSYSYPSHVELVSIYKKLLNLPEMRTAYERFSKHFPLTAELWLDWIKDEMRVANTEKEKKCVVELFDKAVQDYLSVDLWLEYVQFCLSLSVDEARNVFERAVSEVGLHVTRGSLIWDAYREFELAHLAVISDSESSEWMKQAQRVNEIFRRQLSVPLLDMDRTYVEWRVWAERLPKQDFIKKEQVDYVYKKATNYLEDVQSLEDDLLAAKTESDKLKYYREYIDTERKPEHMRVLYERALADLSLDPELWYDYCVYYFDLGNFDKAHHTSERALRNCPWDPDIWSFEMRILETLNKPHDEITACLEKALTIGFQLGQQYLQLWLTYLEHYKRITDPKDIKQVEKLRGAFQKAYKHIADNFGIDGDPECALLRFWAKVEAGFLNDITAARNVWNEYSLMKTVGNVANIWLELLALEQQFGDDKHVRKMYQRALTSTKDWPQSIVQSWICYERQFGSSDSSITTANICRKFMRKYNLQHPVIENSEEKEKNSDKSKQHQGKKRKLYEQKNNTNEYKLKQVKISDEPVPQKEDIKKIEMDPDKQQRSVFLSNLDYSVTEDELKQFLGQVEELRLVKDRRGNSKGYAYCVLPSKEDADIILKRDRELLNNRPVFVSECKVDKMQREPQFKYATSQEKHKLFVKGLPLMMSKEEVEKLFKTHGELKEVRLVTYRNGRSKGLAYVEFKDENDASKAIIAMDNSEVRGFTISVAISDPPKRKIESTAPLPTQEHTRHSKSRINVPLVPRVIQTPQPATTSQPSMSNNDFRKMFNKS